MEELKGHYACHFRDGVAFADRHYNGAEFIAR